MLAGRACSVQNQTDTQISNRCPHCCCFFRFLSWNARFSLFKLSSWWTIFLQREVNDKWNLNKNTFKIHLSSLWRNSLLIINRPFNIVINAPIRDLKRRDCRDREETTLSHNLTCAPTDKSLHKSRCRQLIALQGEYH